MKRNLLIVLFAIAGIGVTVYLSFFSTRQSSPAVVSTTIEQSSPSVTQVVEEMSQYIEYSPSRFDETDIKRRVLFFYASWCPTCRSAEADIKQKRTQIPDDVTIIRVNYNDPQTDNDEKELARKYGITYQHTFVQIDSSGKEITKWNGGELDQLLTRIK
jgi:thiol-disulfide isomerase/thioredoxin